MTAPPDNTLPVRTKVTALIITSGETPYLAATLLAVSRQTLTPTSIYVIDVSNSGVAHRQGTNLIAVPEAANLGQAIAQARKSPNFPNLNPHDTLWVLHDDSAPAATCLAEQIKILESGKSIRVVGPKQRVWDKATQILEVGIQATASGRRLQEMDTGEIDQGQYDHRQDVLAVGTAGMLLNWGTYLELEGFDPALGPYGDGLEFCRRVHLAGYRVTVAPKAVIYHKMADYYGLRGPDGGRPQRSVRNLNSETGTKLHPNPKASFASRRKAQLHNWLVAAPWWQFIFLPPIILTLGLARVFWRLITKELLLASAELRATLATLSKPLPVFKARLTRYRHSRLPARTLKPLQVKAWKIQQAKITQRRVAKDLRQPVMLDSIAQHSFHTERSLDRAIVWSIALTLTALSTLMWRFALTGVEGGALPRIPHNNGNFWDTLISGWLPAGLGYGTQIGTADPLGTILAILGQGAAWLGIPNSTVLSIALILASPLAWLAAWWASGVLTSSRPIRALAALSWALSPTLLASLSRGEISVWTLSLSLPLTLGAIARAKGMGVNYEVATQNGQSNFTVYSGRIIVSGVASLTAFLSVAASQILVLPLCLLVMLAWLKNSPTPKPETETSGNTPPPKKLKFTHAAIILAPALVLTAPTLARTAANPSQLPLWLSSLSVAQTQPTPKWWDLTAGWPIQLGSVELALSFPGWQILAYLPLTLLLITAAVAVLTPRTSTAAQWSAIFALLGLTIATLAVNTPVALSGSTPVAAWPGPGLALYHAGLISTALSLISRVKPRRPETGHSRTEKIWKTLTVAAVIVPILGASPLLINQISTRNNQFNTLETYREDSIPATVTQGQAGNQHQRALHLQLSPAPKLSTLMEVKVWNNWGETTVEASPWLKLKTLQLAQGKRTADSADLALSHLAASLMGGATPQLNEELAQLNTNFIVVPPNQNPATTALSNSLDAVGSLQRVTTTPAGTIWRMKKENQTSMGRISTAVWRGGKPSWPKDPEQYKLLKFHANQAEIPAGASGRLLALSMRADNNMKVLFNGIETEKIDGEQWFALYRIPDGQGTITLSYTYLPYQIWAILLLSTLLVSVAAAIPLRRVTQVR